MKNDQIAGLAGREQTLFSYMKCFYRMCEYSICCVRLFAVPKPLANLGFNQSLSAALGTEALAEWQNKIMSPSFTSAALLGEYLNSA